MSDPFDVSLRVRLNYEAGGAAKTAVADVEAIRAAAGKLGASSGLAGATRDLDGLVRRAAIAKAGLDDLARAGARLAASGGGSARLAADVSAVVRPAAEATRGLVAVAAATTKLGQVAGTISGDGMHALSTKAVAARRAIADTTAAAGRLATVQGPAAMTAEMGKAARAGAELEGQIDALLASGGKLAAWRPAQVEAAMKSIDAQAKAGRGEIGAMEAAASKLGAVPGPKHLATGLQSISPAAVEARRHVDDVADAALHAERSLQEMGKASRALGDGPAGGGGGKGQGGGQGAGHGPGGIRGALVAGARPLHMERVLASAMTPIGLAGFGVGLGISEVGRALTAAQKQSIDFEAEMVAVKRAVGDIPADSLKELQGHLLEVSAATGATKEQVTGMAAAAARAGTPVAELGHVVERTAKVANVFGISTDEASEKLTRYGKSWHADQARTDDTTDAIALLAQKNGANGGAMLDFINANPELRANNVSARQLAAFGATGQRVGLAPEEMKGLFGNLTEKLRAPEKAGDDFKDELGLDLKINPSDARLRMRDDPTTLITQILDSLKGKSEAARQRAAERLLGPEEGERLAKLAGGVDVLRQNLELAENSAQRSGAVQKLFDTFDETTRAKVDHMTASFDNMAVKLGSKLLPAIGASAEALAHLFDQLAQEPKGAMGLAEGASALVSKVAGGKQSDAYNDMLKQRARTRGAKTDAEVEAWIKANRPGDYDGIYRPERRTKDDAYTPAGRDPVLRDVQPVPGRTRSVDELKRTEDFLARQLSGAKPEHATNIQRQLDEVRRQLDAVKAAPSASDAVARRAPDKHASTLDPSMIHRAAYVEGGDDRAVAGRSPTDELRGVMAGATKEGVVAGLREFALMGGGTAAAGGIVNASWEAGDGSAGSGEGGGSAHRGGSGAPNMRYGREPHAAALPNMRYGRGAGAGGGAYRDTPDGHAGHARSHPTYRHTPEGRSGSAPDAGGSVPGDGSSMGWTAAILRKKEGFIGKAAWDVDHFRLGYGSDTITDKDGHVREVQRGDTVSREDAERDLKRRMPEFQGRLRKEVGGGNWDRLDPATKGALTSVGYNYGSFAKLGSLRAAVATGDKAKIADAVRGLQGHNGGVNRQRRLEEASIIETGHLPSAWRSRDPSTVVARGAVPDGRVAAAMAPNTALSSREAARAVARHQRLEKGETVSPRFSNPTMKRQASPDAGMTSASAGGAGGQVAQGPAPIQHFYGMHDPAQTARMAMLENNREVRRTQARALHSLGRVA